MMINAYSTNIVSKHSLFASDLSFHFLAHGGRHLVEIRSVFDARIY